MRMLKVGCLAGLVLVGVQGACGQDFSVLRAKFPAITNIVVRSVEERDGNAKDVLARWAASAESTKLESSNSYVQIDFVLRPEPGSDIRCRLLLPPAKVWDGRLWGQGNSGSGGTHVSRLYLYPASGTAVVTTDLGTWKVTNNGTTNFEAWPECVKRDYDWRATHLMTVWGTKIATEYYGRAPAHRYFCGGSCGGRQAMSEAIRFPEDYESMICFLPGNLAVVKEAAMFSLRLATHDATTGALLFTTNEMRVVADAACEYKGVKVLDDPRFTEAEIDGFLALAAKKAPRLAQGDRLARLKSLYMPVMVNGECVFNGFAPGAYLGKNMRWDRFIRFANFLKERGYAKTATYNQGTWEQFLEFARTDGPGYNSCSTELSAFFARGGKILMTIGLEDQTVPPYMTMSYYDALCAANGGLEKLRKSCLLWCLPGCAHGGGKGRIRTCPPNGPSFRQALTDWAEKGKAPPKNLYPGWLYPEGPRGRVRLAPIAPRFLETNVNVEK